VAEIRAAEGRTTHQATVALPELRRGNVAVVIATVTPGFLAADVGPNFQPQSALYRTPQEAEAQALILLKSVADLDDHLTLWRNDRVPGIVLLMEGADPIVHVRDLPRWWRRGLRMVGLTFGDTRYGRGVAGGSSTMGRGGLTPEGIALLDSMTELGFMWDISHLTDDGVWEGLGRGPVRVCASHANARALTPTDRHLSDEVIRAVAARDGVIGLVLYNGFLDSAWRRDHAIPVSVIDQLARHAAHMAGLIGWSHLGIGSDLDGGFGREECPREIDSITDLARAGDAAPTDARERLLGGNWLRFLRTALPRSAA
jgi:membrane dipeptidase